MSRRAPCIWLVVMSIMVLTAAILAPAAQADPAHQDPTPTPTADLSVIEAAAHLTKGIAAYTEAFDTPTAYAELTAAIEADPHLLAAYLWRAQLYYDVGALDLALADVNVVLASEPNNVDGLILRALIYNGPFQLDIPYEDFLLRNFGLAGYGRQTELALADINTVLELDDTNPAAWFALARILATKWIIGQHVSPPLRDEAGFGDLDETLDQMTTSLRSAIDWGITEAEVAYWGGFISLQPIPAFVEEVDSEVREQAITLLEGYLDTDSNTPRAYHARASIAWLEMRPNDALAELQAGLSQFPNHARLQFWLTMLALNLRGSHDVDREAVRALVPVSADRAVELAPYSAPYLYIQAVHNMSDETAGQLEHLLSIAPSYPPALETLARLYVEEGTTTACQRASELSDAYLTTPLEYMTRSFWEFDFPPRYAENCLPPTPTPLSIPVTDARHQVGDTITIPGFAVFPLNTDPLANDSAIVCSSGTEATVLQVIRLEDANMIYVQLECDGGIGWIEEALLP